MSRTVLVTGATGYIAKHIVLQLLERGDRVVGTIRNAQRDDELRAAMSAHLSDPSRVSNLRTVVLNLDDDQGWDTAMDGIDAVLHTASPFPLAQPKDEDDLIRPAVDGTLRALKAAKAAGIRRVVLTSSAVAVMTRDAPANGKTFTEDDWSDLDSPRSTAYGKSKTLAERAAWDFVRDSDGAIDLTTINPVFVMGPPLDANYGTSIEAIERILKAKDPMLPNIGFPVVDVCDVAAAHIAALDTPESIGQRVIATDRWLWFRDIAQAIKTALPDRKIVTRVSPDIFIRFLGLFDPTIRLILPQLGRRDEVSGARARALLGIEFRDGAVAVQDAARWLVENRGL